MTAIEGMKAENKIREMKGETLAYDSEHFMNVGDELLKLSGIAQDLGRQIDDIYYQFSMRKEAVKERIKDDLGRKE